MTEFVKMDIFFFITTIVVVVLGVLMVLILLRVWQILGHVERISRDVSEESALLRSDIATLRSDIRIQGFKFRHLKTLFSSALKRFTSKKKT